MIRNDKGISLIEVSIAIALVGVMGLGMASMFTEMAKQQNAANVKALLASQKVKIEALIKDSRSWSASVNNTLNDGQKYLTCLRVPPTWTGQAAGTGCWPAGNSETFTQLNGTSNGMALFENPLGPAWYNSLTAANGFTSRGVLCATWPSTACPIRWDFSITISCQSATPCLSPTVQVVAVPNIPRAQMETLNLSINPDNYKVDVTRGIGTRFDPILVTERIVTSVNNGGGPCATTPLTVTRKLNTIENDPAKNVTLVGNNISFIPGSYSCRITSPAFKVGSHTILWMQGATEKARSTGASSSIKYPVITNAVLEVSFVISSTTQFHVEHTCERSDQTPANVQMGYSTDYSAAGGGAVYTTVACYRNG